MPIAATETITMKIALFTLDNWYLWSQIAVVLCGAAALITGKMVNDRQSSKNAEQARQLLGLETNLEKQREKTAQAEVEIEKLRNANLTLEAAISDRTFKDQGGAASRLRKFANIELAIMYAGTKEAQETAEQIAWVIVEAGWKLRPRSIVPVEELPFQEGVAVILNQSSSGPTPQSSETIAANERASAACDALIDELNKTGITAAKRTIENAKLPTGLVVIQVGVKPDPLLAKFVQDAMGMAARAGRPVLIQSANRRVVP